MLSRICLKSMVLISLIWARRAWSAVARVMIACRGSCMRTRYRVMACWRSFRSVWEYPKLVATVRCMVAS